jgi:hypothetical protein
MLGTSSPGGPRSVPSVTPARELLFPPAFVGRGDMSRAACACAVRAKAWNSRMRLWRARCGTVPARPSCPRALSLRSGLDERTPHAAPAVVRIDEPALDIAHGSRRITSFCIGAKRCLTWTGSARWSPSRIRRPRRWISRPRGDIDPRRRKSPEGPVTFGRYQLHLVEMMTEERLPIDAIRHHVVIVRGVLFPPEPHGLPWRGRESLPHA